MAIYDDFPISKWSYSTDARNVNLAFIFIVNANLCFIEISDTAETDVTWNDL